MTSENATRDRSQGTFWRKSAKSNPKGNTGNANKKKKQISNGDFFLSRLRMYPIIVNGRICTSCEEACMGAFKTAWALGFIPQRGITYSIET